MHLTRDIGTNAAAIMWGARARDLGFCEAGVVEQYAEIGEAAEFLAQHEAAIGDLLEGGFPGVFAYEVAEELGSWMDRVTNVKEPIAFTTGAKQQAVRLLADFFLGNLIENDKPLRECCLNDYSAVLSYLADTFPDHDWTEWRKYVVEERPTETRFDFVVVFEPWVVGDTVFLRDGVHVRKGEIKRIICVQSIDTAGKRDTVTNIEVHWQGVINTVMLSSSDVAKLKRTAEEAFA